MAPSKQRLSEQVATALRGGDDSYLIRLLDSALESGVIGPNTPAVINNAAARVAVSELRSAVRKGDPKELKGALVMAARLNASELPEYEAAAAKYREIRKLPEGWQAMQARRGQLMGRAPVQDKSLVNLFQQLFDSTHRSVYTRDRRGQPIPQRLRVESVFEVQNDDVWFNYALRREEIRQELAGSAAKVTVVTDAALQEGSKQTGQVLPGPPLERDVNEVLLFHGTHPIAADRIAKTNFSINLAGSNAGALYGKGLYLAENTSKSDEYCRPGPGGLCTMLLCRAVLGKAFETAELEPNPRACEAAVIRGSSHSIIGDRLKCRGTFREFVFFDQDQIYPSFLISYQRLF